MTEKHEWSCGHVAGSMCAECFRELAAKAHVLAEECERLKGILDTIADRADRGGRRIETAMTACEEIEALARDTP
jgi:hypothetical protein